MANNVSFLLGTQEKINSLLKSPVDIVPGAFYVTNDTHRMYYGVNATSIVSLNQGVITVENVAALASVSANPGEFYYATSENVLCIKSKAANGAESWVQINADTKNTSMATAAALTDNQVVVTTTLTDNHGNEFGSGDNGLARFAIQGQNMTVTLSDGNVITLTAPEYNLALDTNNNGQVNFTKNGTTIGGFVLGNDDGTIEIKNSNGRIVLSGSEGNKVESFTSNIAVNANVATVQATLDQSVGDPLQPVLVKISGDDNIEVTRNASDVSQIDLKTSTYDIGVSAGADNKTANIELNKTSSDGSSTEIVDSVVLVGGTGVDSVAVDAENNKITINTVDNHIDSITVDETAGFKVFVNESAANDSKTFTINPKIHYGDSANPSDNTVTFTNGIADLNVYTKDEVKELISKSEREQSAMRFKGTIDSIETLNALADVKAGDTYKVTGDFQVNGQSVKLGDLLIASGTDDNEDGVLETIVWNYVPSADDVDNYKVINNDGTGFTLVRETATDDEILISYSVNGEGVISAEADATAGDKNTTVTIKHNKVTDSSPVPNAAVTQEAKGSVTINAVTAVGRDEYGHVNSVTTQEFVLTDTDTHNNLDRFNSAVQVVDNGAKIASVVGMTDNNDEKSTSFNIVSESNQSLLVSVKDAENVAISLVWGTF